MNKTLLRILIFSVTCIGAVGFFGILLGCESPVVKAGENRYNTPKFKSEYLGNIGAEGVYKVRIDSSEYIVIKGGNSSAGIIKHK